jgi:hypothetical protein
MKCVFNLVWNLLLKHGYLEDKILTGLHYLVVITILYSNQPFPSNTIGEKIFSISSSSKVAIKNFSHFFYPLYWLVYRIHISYDAF